MATLTPSIILRMAMDPQGQDILARIASSAGMAPPAAGSGGDYAQGLVNSLQMATGQGGSARVLPLPAFTSPPNPDTGAPNAALPQQPSSEMPNMQGLSNLMPTQATGMGLGGEGASPSFMGEGAGFAGPDAIGGFNTSLAGGGSAAEAGVMPTVGGASNATAAPGTAAVSSGGGGFSWMGPAAAYAALIGGAKIGQNKMGSGFGSRAIHGAFGPSISQMMEDPKQIPMMAVSPMLAGAFGSDKSIEKDPEWFPLLGGAFGTG